MEIDGGGNFTVNGGIQGATLVDGPANGFEQWFFDLASVA